MRAAFEQYRRNRHIIVEPVAGNANCVRRCRNSCGLRALCDEVFGALLIIDEVTGFRVAYGRNPYYGVVPDLTCLGKIIGGGMPVGALAVVAM